MSNENDSRLDDFLERLCHGALSPDENGELRSRLRSSKSARQAYIRYISLHFWLHSRFARLKPETLTPGPPHQPRHQGATLPSGRWAGPLAAAAAIALVSISAFWLGGTPVASPKGAQRQMAGVVASTESCRWARRSDAKRLGQTLHERDLVALDAGVAEIVLDSGVRLLARGPVELRVMGKGCELTVGEVAARVPDDVEGFAIRAGALDVEDLGTEFGVRRSAAGEVELEVLEGEVALYDASSATKSVDRTPIAALKSGQGVRVSSQAGRIEKTLDPNASLAAGFLREPPSSAERIDDLPDRLIVADGFAGLRDGAPLHGLVTGFGWLAPWSSDRVAYADASVLAFAAKATNNGSGNCAVHRDLTAGLMNGQPVFASARFRIAGDDPVCTAWVLLFARTNERGAGESDLMAFGLSDGKFSARLASATEDLAVLPAAKWSGDFGDYATGAEHTIVARLEFDAIGDDERLSLWVDPSASATQRVPVADHVVRRNTGRAGADAVALRFWEMNGETRGYIDDLRIGTSWRSVVE